MKSIGVVRKVDQLGRIVIPKELRRTMNININDPLEIFVDEQRIVLQKYTPACIFCDQMEGTSYHKGKLVCQSCREEIAQL